MELESLTAELLARPLSEFTPSRNSKAKELKAAGQAEVASQLSALRKPSAHLWAVNRLSDQRALLKRLQQASQAVVKAQLDPATNAAVALRSASEEFQQALESAGNEAGDVLRQHGHAS